MRLLKQKLAEADKILWEIMFKQTDPSPFKARTRLHVIPCNSYCFVFSSWFFVRLIWDISSHLKAKVRLGWDEDEAEKFKTRLRKRRMGRGLGSFGGFSQLRPSRFSRPQNSWGALGADWRTGRRTDPFVFYIFRPTSFLTATTGLRAGPPPKVGVWAWAGK